MSDDESFMMQFLATVAKYELQPVAGDKKAGKFQVSFETPVFALRRIGIG
jgi:hypothetical protein